MIDNFNKVVWNDELDGYIRDNYLNKSDAQLMLDINKMFNMQFSWKAVNTRRRRLGLLKATKFGRKSLTRISVKGKKYRVVIRQIYTSSGEPSSVIACMLEKPYYMGVGDTARSAIDAIKRRILRRIKNTDRITQSVKVIRDLWNNDPDMSIADISARFKISKGVITHIIYNTLYHDPGYSPTARPKPNPVVRIFGERKTLARWAEDSRCKVSFQLLYLRYFDRKIRGEALLLNKFKNHYVKIGNESQTLAAWSRDARCEVPYETLRGRIRQNPKDQFDYNILKKSP